MESYDEYYSKSFGSTYVIEWGLTRIGGSCNDGTELVIAALSTFSLLLAMTFLIDRLNRLHNIYPES